MFFEGYLLDMLHNAYFNGKLNHRRRRDSTELGKRKNQSVTSMFLEPTFERSLMTMSFLMFGVFVIQVVQVSNKINIRLITNLVK